MNTKENRRVQYTKSMLKKSLLTLLKDKSIDKITVKEICTLADLNRGTFYAYYSSPGELLAQIEDEFYIHILDSVAAFKEAEDVVTIFTQALTAFQEKAELSAVVFGHNGDREFLMKLVNVARPVCLYQWSYLNPEADERTLEMSYDFLSYGCMRVIQQWLLGGMQETPQEVANLLNDLTNEGILFILQKTRAEAELLLRH